MKIKTTSLLGVVIIQPTLYHDERGHFYESYNSGTWQEHGLPSSFIQDNQSFSYKGVLRGLHFQKGEFAQGKLVRVIKGRVLDIAVDIRPDSRTFGRYEFFDLDGETNTMVYIPEGFAHGFLALEDSIFSYKCTAGYHKASEGGILWNDPTLQIEWPIAMPIVSDKDKLLPTFEELFKSLSI